MTLALSPARYDEARESLPPSDFVEDLLLEVRRAHVVLDQAYKMASHPMAGSGEVKGYNTAAGRWQDLLDHCNRERERYRREVQEARAVGEWDRDIRLLEQRLLGIYGGLGEQYRVLCALLAPMAIRLRRSYSGQLSLGQTEQIELTKTVGGMVAQLQKHTEVTRTEESRMANDTLTKVLGVVERSLANQPRIFQRVLEDVQREFEMPPGQPDDMAEEVA